MILAGASVGATLQRRRGAAKYLSLASLVFCLAAGAIHVGWGHRPSSAEGMGLQTFVKAHPALPFVATVAAAVFLRARRKDFQ